VDEGFLKLGEEPHAAGSGGDELELFRGVHLGALGHGNVEPTQNDGGGAFKQAHGGSHQGHEDEHGRGDSDGESLGTAQGEGLGNEFADHDMEVGNEGEA